MVAAIAHAGGPADDLEDLRQDLANLRQDLAWVTADRDQIAKDLREAEKIAGDRINLIEERARAVQAQENVATLVQEKDERIADLERSFEMAQKQLAESAKREAAIVNRWL